MHTAFIDGVDVSIGQKNQIHFDVWKFYESGYKPSIMWYVESKNQYEKIQSKACKISIDPPMEVPPLSILCLSERNNCLTVEWEKIEGNAVFRIEVSKDMSFTGKSIVASYDMKEGITYHEICDMTESHKYARLVVRTVAAKNIVLKGLPVLLEAGSDSSHYKSLYVRELTGGKVAIDLRVYGGIARRAWTDCYLGQTAVIWNIYEAECDRGFMCSSNGSLVGMLLNSEERSR